MVDPSVSPALAAVVEVVVFVPQFFFVEILVHQVVKNISHKASIIVTPRRRAARGG